MKKLLLTIMTGVTLSASLAPQLSRADGYGAGLRRRVSVTCTALLATAAVGLSAGYTMSGEIRNPGFSSRVVWASDRRAVVALLGRAFRLRMYDSPSRNHENVVIEAVGFDPEYFREVTFDNLNEGLLVTSATSARVTGHVLIQNQLLFFELVRQPSGATKFKIMSSLQ